VCNIAHYAISSSSRRGCLVFGGKKVERHRAEVNEWLQRHARLHPARKQKLIKRPYGSIDLWHKSYSLMISVPGRGREIAKSILIDFEIGMATSHSMFNKARIDLITIGDALHRRNMLSRHKLTKELILIWPEVSRNERLPQLSCSSCMKVPISRGCARACATPLRVVNLPS
jgi:hypothetical protein